ncbi:glycosyltransferase family 1 protein [Collybia nuda]|uniref:sterol 3beta-glucosyltransferase n=1 Tax=Collybia nuda TaxID=64659 RepID=A0A9P5YEN3_9AGAR|nr:glycosyltransferase family 1 protein [Collybia nuda]
MKPTEPPTMSQIYCDAAAFEKVLAGSGCINSRGSDKNGANGFADLVGRDLNSSEKAVAGRIARLCVTQYSWTPDDPTAEIDTHEEPKSPDHQSWELEKPLESPVIHRVQADNDDTWKLNPRQIIDLLVQEFGPLTSEGEEERLVLETDGCLIHDVIIVGVIHITTHRLTFHASLFSSHPNLPPSQRIIKAGPAILHRKGWRSKRRVWLELSHDMMCTYASSGDEGRIRPLCTILLSFIDEVLPPEPKQPRHMRIKLGPKGHSKVDYAEFDTEESAQDWRRELTGAIFLQRHQRREALENPDVDVDTGVRLSCPLNRVARVQFGGYAEFPCIASLCIVGLPSDERSDNFDESITETQTIHIGTVRPNPVWGQLDDYVKVAKRRLECRPLEQFPVLIDFGPLSFSETQSSWDIDDTVPGLKEKTVRNALSLSASESDLWIIRARVYRNISSSGYLVVSQHFVCFWGKSFTPCDVKYRIPTATIQSVKSFHLNFCRLDGLTLELKGQPSLKILFSKSTMRDEAVYRISSIANSYEINQTISNVSHLSSSPESLDPLSPMTISTTSSNGFTRTPSKQLNRSATGIFAPLSRSLAAAVAVGLPPAVQLKMPKAINLPREILTSMAPLHFVCLTIGSRGDVQPYIALGLGLMKEGHRVTIVTHVEYREWIISFGINHRTAGGDPGALMKLSVDNKMFSPEFFRESLSKFRPWLDHLLADAWEGCRDADVLLESPSAMAGVHIAEALNIPYIRTFTMPWTKTNEFPHPFLSPPVESPTFNSASNVMWTATSGQINRWRRRTMKIPNTDMGHLAQSKIVFIYNFSQAVVSKPLDWPDTTNISGYWFLDNPDLNWSPPADLLTWMAKARADGKAIVYIGFGSITVPHPKRVTARIVEAVLQSDVRAIISKGWSSRMNKSNKVDNDVNIPPECYIVDKIPHDWLFPRIDAALHHGGAGTTGASLRAGIPTIIKPWFGDQFFWGSRVQKLGAGLRVPSLRVNEMAAALIKATTSTTMKEKAGQVGEKIRSEDGVHTAIHTIYTYLPRASLKRASLGK